MFNQPKSPAQGSSTSTVIQNTSGPQTKILPRFGSSLRILNTGQTSLPSAKSPVSSPFDETIPDALERQGPEDDDNNNDDDDDSMRDLYDDDDDDDVSPRPRRHRRRNSVRNSPPPTLNSSSPLVERLKQQQSRHVRKSKAGSSDQMQDKSQEYRAFSEKVKDVLLRCKEEMNEDHAVYVRYALMDARVPIEARIPKFMDEVSPFASFQPVNSERNHSDGNEILKIVSTVCIIHWL
jgi:hypothetical protein